MDTDRVDETLTSMSVPTTPLQVEVITDSNARLKAENKKHEKVEMDHTREMQSRDTVTPKILAILIVVGFFAVLFWLLAFGVKPDTSDSVPILVGALILALGTVMSFHFGTSSGSSRKTEAILTKLNEGQ